MDPKQIKYLGDVQRLELKPGDVLVLSTSDRLTTVQTERMKTALASVIPDHKIIVLEAGLKLCVLG